MLQTRFLRRSKNYLPSRKYRPFLVIDEAHLLKAEILDEIRLMHNNQFDSCDYLATALVGKPPLKKL